MSRRRRRRGIKTLRRENNKIVEKGLRREIKLKRERGK